jgi:hypothetical protein
MNKFQSILFVGSLVSCTNVFAVNIYSTEDSTIDINGSLRIQAESVSVDQGAVPHDDSYSGLRDAYSGFGVSASTTVGGGITLGTAVDFTYNSAELRAEDPSFFEGSYKENDSKKIYNIYASSDKYGSITWGKQWLAYYNNIGYPVDYFSSYYSGFATHAAFRREALTYTTPTVAGFSGTVSGVDFTDSAGTSYLDTMQYVVSYAKGDITAAIAYQDTHDNRANLIGASASYTTGPWRFATKVEQLRSGSGVETNKDPLIYNVYGSYTVNQWTFKAMFANGDGKEGDSNQADNEGDAFFIGDSYELGVDYQYSDKIKFFVDYFYEENSYAISPLNNDTYELLADYQTKSHGTVFSVGTHIAF